jgi:single-stranded-DNA-specific exonuclease
MKNFVGWVSTGKNKKKLFLKDGIEGEAKNFPPFIERIFKRRNIKLEELDQFLDPKYEHLTPYSKWEKLKIAIETILWAINNKKNIHIHSDYDVDGITSLSMLLAGIKNFGGNFSYTVSNRFKGGYGISEDCFNLAIENKCHLFISLDCGTSSLEIHKKAKEKGIKFLIFDHHQPLQEIDNFVFLCNTHNNDCPKEFKKFSTAGIIFKLMEGLYKSYNKDFPYKSYLRLASLGLAQDIVEMLGENHSIVSLGMKEIPKTKHPFLRALLKISGLEGRNLNSNHLYFRLGPRLNAPGRMDDSSFLIDLFINPDERKVEEGIEKVEKYNRLRQEIQEKIFQEAKEGIGDEKIYVSYNPNWHIGVLGLVASRISQEYNKISFCLSKDGNLIKGSGRSIANFSLLDILDNTKEFLEGYGGHSMACGLSLKEEKLKIFKEKLIDISKNFNLENDLFLEAEEEITFKELLEGLKYFEKMEPYGNKNPKPLFLSHNIRFYEKPIIVNNTYFMKFSQENIIVPGFAFGIEKIEFPKEFSIVYYPAFNDNYFSIQLVGILIK